MTQAAEATPLRDLLESTFARLGQASEAHTTGLSIEEIGVVRSAGHGVARIAGLPRVKSEDLIRLADGGLGMAFSLEEDEVGVVLLGDSRAAMAGSQARRTGRVLDTPVGEALLGRVVTPNGDALDGRGPIAAGQRLPVEREAPPIMARAPVTVPLQTGIKAIDALIPIGRGQRELILGDRQTGKTAIALDTILNQKDQDVICVYCAVGQRGSGVAQFVAQLEARHALEYSVVVVATSERPPGVQFIAPYAATTMAEYFMEQGRDVLIVYDDLTRHAWSYRELSLLLRRPPGREAYPGDIFYLHSRLLERATQLRQGGSLTALPIAETEAQNVSAYIPTNLISITDGQVYLSPDLFQKGILPAVDVGRSVSRVGGEAQLRAYRAVSGDLRLSYSQFEELESFARIGAHLDDDARSILERGRRVREVLKQPQYEPIPVAEQIVALLAVSAGEFDRVPLEQIDMAARDARRAAAERLPDVARRIGAGEKLSEADRTALLHATRQALAEAEAGEARGSA